MKEIKAVLIDVENKSVSWVKVPVDKDYNEYWQAIYKLGKFDIGTMVRTEKNNHVIVDDEGLLKNPRFGFYIGDYPQPLAGNGIIVGPEVNGIVTDCTLTNEDVKRLVKIGEFN